MRMKVGETTEMHPGKSAQSSPEVPQWDNAGHLLPSFCLWSILSIPFVLADRIRSM
jgi:hypothetical protein